MALSKSSIKRVDVIYTPLNVSCKIVAFGGVPDRQVYNRQDGGFSPEYSSLTPLTLYPICTAVNPDKDTDGDGIVNGESKQFSFAWYELQWDTTKKKYVRNKAIVTGDDYTVISSPDASTGLVAGMLKVTKNSSLTDPIRLEFEAKYVEPNSGQTYTFLAQKTILVEDCEQPPTILHVTPTSVAWNPLKDPSTVIYKAQLVYGDRDVTNDANTKFLWYRKTNISGNSYSLEAITGGAEDVDIIELSTKKANIDGKEVDVQGATMTVDADQIGNEEAYICRAIYRLNGLTTDTEYKETDPEEHLCITRFIPNLECSYGQVGNTSDEDLVSISPHAIVTMGGEVLPDREDVLIYRWYAKYPSDSSFKEVATGANPTIPYQAGMVLQLEVDDRGPNVTLVDDDLAVLVDDDGNYLYGKL